MGVARSNREAGESDDPSFHPHRFPDHNPSCLMFPDIHLWRAPYNDSLNLLGLDNSVPGCQLGGLSELADCVVCFPYRWYAYNFDEG